MRSSERCKITGLRVYWQGCVILVVSYPGKSFPEIIGNHPGKPFVLLAQQSLFDPSRAPEGKHTAWAYCHVPNGSVKDIGQLFTRPALRLSPYRTSAKGMYICSSSTPPGGGVHGMCGYHAARRALKDIFNIKAP
ncbi:hypothetical protein [Agriterribacter sp.]|uniref:hypothetical protein n=1 Tax=Agriterribacter sp. TaxID=2821509 RepID=UPI002C5A73FD|nr:hypothetical protein [Agriterribacter sp.]HRO44590.1 hypothetical protein [Agriterribacter sp.]HRQ16027.1 hypothetical protein [Agriterribacter sp.]